MFALPYKPKIQYDRRIMWQIIVTALLSILFGSGIALLTAHMLWRRAYPEKHRQRFLILSLICLGVSIFGITVIWLVFR